MNAQNIKTKIEENRKEIIIGGLTLVGLGVLGYFGIKGIKGWSSLLKDADDKLILDMPNSTEKTLEDLVYKSTKGFTCDEAWYEDTYVNLILNDFTIKDIGALGEDIMANVPGTTEDTVLTAMIGVLDIKKGDN